MTPHGRCGIRAKSTVISGFEGGEHPADGGRNELRGRLRAHHEPELQRAERLSRTTSPREPGSASASSPRLTRRTGSRGRRFETKPGESYQMDWGFVRVEGWDGGDFKISVLRDGVPSLPGTCYVGVLPERPAGEPLHRHGAPSWSSRAACRNTS